MLLRLRCRALILASGLYGSIAPASKSRPVNGSVVTMRALVSDFQSRSVWPRVSRQEVLAFAKWIYSKISRKTERSTLRFGRDGKKRRPEEEIREAFWWIDRTHEEGIWASELGHSAPWERLHPSIFGNSWALNHWKRQLPQFSRCSGPSWLMHT